MGSVDSFDQETVLDPVRDSAGVAGRDWPAVAAAAVEAPADAVPGIRFLATEPG